ncbi:nicotinate phosphoribosyltransferase [Haloarchaeobius sp. HME9146]|uniref:nicotinate phosphoribosyltransferase n=1 Tax=Haloarchaeobius sp. HME9146 TaxID=2978732 RepID=UPI0021C10EC0|nr:nicotinate phosphoribosyltransferase [Haloarchaeobius sp. HME9146]MCT9098248.1 nicotinate phosphoribosyltransferase [Haloarchaeobius sp. HME9146]
MSSPTFGYLTPENLALFTDRYELTMLQGYHAQGHNPQATFSLFFRDLPDQRGYAIAAGLEQVLHYVETLEFGERALSYLEAEGFSEPFLDELADFSFSGEIWAVPEGTPVFPDEPILEVTAPIFEAQLLETAVINQVNFQTLVATKARRMRDAVERLGDGQSLVDFGSRRAHGTDAGLKAARAAYIGGFTGTSNDAAAEAFDIPAFGTMAHSWIQSFPTEREAFAAFVEEYGEDSTLLVDTYDTIAGAELAVSVADELGVPLGGVRLDSGDLAALSKEVADIVGDADIFVSSGLDEFEIAEFLARGGVADGFGPGTRLVTSADQSSLDAVYKLVAVEHDGEMQPSMKLSSGKVTYPGPKSVRRLVTDGKPVEDVLGIRGEEGPGTELLQPVVENGTLVGERPSLDVCRDRAIDQLRRFDERYRSLERPERYQVTISDGLSSLTDELQQALEAQLERR